jgi:hypothetical protein
MRGVMLFLAFLAFLAAVSPGAAMAETAGIPAVAPDEVASKVREAIGDILMPIGALVIFVVLAWMAFKLIITSQQPEERARVMGGLPYILGGGLLLGGVLLVTGFILWMAERMA